MKDHSDGQGTFLQSKARGAVWRILGYALIAYDSNDRSAAYSQQIVFTQLIPEYLCVRT